MWEGCLEGNASKIKEFILSISYVRLWIAVEQSEKMGVSYFMSSHNSGLWSVMNSFRSSWVRKKKNSSSSSSNTLPPSSLLVRKNDKDWSYMKETSNDINDILNLVHLIKFLLLWPRCFFKAMLRSNFLSIPGNSPVMGAWTSSSHNYDGMANIKHCLKQPLLLIKYPRWSFFVCGLFEQIIP